MGIKLEFVTKFQTKFDLIIFFNKYFLLDTKIIIHIYV